MPSPHVNRKLAAIMFTDIVEVEKTLQIVPWLSNPISTSRQANKAIVEEWEKVK